jgi:hypothetical protein
MKMWLRAVVATSVLAATQASANDETLKWQTVVGIIQAGNVVAGIAGGGLPWSTLGGNAFVNLGSGRVHFRVDGLVLAGGNAIGTPGPITEVKGTLVCDTDGDAGGPLIIDTQTVPLNEEGDAHFDGELGTLPGACSTEPDVAFLIRIANAGMNAGRWIANGAVLHR